MNFFKNHNHPANKKIIFTYLFYISFIAVCAYLFAHLFSKKFYVFDFNNNIILENISFEFGELISNLFYKKGYYHTVEGVKYYLQKLPVIPLLLLFASKISLNYFFVIVFKNIIVFSSYFLLAYLLTKDFVGRGKFFFLILIIPVAIPYNFSVALNYVYEDSIIALFLPLLFLSLISKSHDRLYIASIILFILYFVKTSMFLICVLIPLCILIFEKKISIIIKALPVVASILAIIIWGSFGFAKTGKFPFASSGASNNSYVFSFALNKEFGNFYPDKSIDLIPQEKPNITFNTEWEWFDYYDQKNKDYLKNNFITYLKDSSIKLKYIFFGVHRDGSYPDQNDNYDNSLRFSLIFSKLFFNLALILCIIRISKNLKNILLIKEDLYFLFIVSINLVPHIIGWATAKHLVASSNISMIYLLFLFVKKYNQKFI
jgi:hypothetical protein